MKKTDPKEIVISVIIVLFTLMAVAGFLIFVYNTEGKMNDQKIQQGYQRLKTINTNYSQQISLVSGVTPELQKVVQQVVEDAVSGSYGEKGADEVLHFINEKHIALDENKRKKILQLLEKGRDEFKIAQTDLAHALQNYNDMLSNQPSGNILAFLGYPEVPLSSYKHELIE